MAGLTWLHLSDWHQKGEDFDRKVVRDKLLEDLRRRAKIDPALARIDFVVFSGDLAWAGQPKEYQAAQQHFLDPVLKAVELTPAQLFLVPGNHDLDRNAFGELPPVLLKPLASEKLVQERLTTEKRARSLEPMTAYSAFVESYSRQPSPQYASLREWTVDERKVALLGLNSAWMCGRNKKKKEVDDYGKIVIGEPQVHDALDLMARADVRIVVMHHPFDWLTDFDRNRVEARITKGAHFLLRGHTHDPKVLPVNGTDGACVIIPAGAAYERRDNTQRYANAYNFVHLDFATGGGRVFLRRWSDPRSEWREDVDTAKGGVFPFPLPKALGKTSLSAARASRARTTKKAQGTSSQQERHAAEMRYRALLLETCDIVDLAGLPEDRHVIQRRLELRRLYLPLRARVEPPPGEEAVDASWDKVEARRNATWLGRAREQEADDVKEPKRVPIGERLAAARRLVVLGDPGAGKTTLTRWIATAYLLRLNKDPDWKDLHDVRTLPDADWLPIIVRCRDLDVACLAGALDDVLQHTFRKAELSKNEGVALVGLLRERLSAGTALLILDGLDEIADAQVRARFCQQIEKIVVAYPLAPVIATSRVVGYREMGYRLGRSFEHLGLAELSRKEKDQFAERWCTLTELPERRERVAADLVRDIHSSERIERLTGNPMLLTTMAIVRRKVGRLPNRRAELYAEAVQVLLHWRSEVDEALDWQEAVPQLEYLSYAMCDRGVQRLPRDEVIALFERMRSEHPQVHAVHKRTPEAFLRAVEARTGLLTEAGHVRHLGLLVPVYEFRHLTFQEYLAARALVDGRFPGRDPAKSLAEHVAPLASRMGEARFRREVETAVTESWREPLRLCVAMCADADVDAILEVIVTAREDDAAGAPRARAIQAVLCLADEPNASRPVAQRVFKLFAAQVGDEDGSGGASTGIDAAAVEAASTRWAADLRQVLVAEFRGREPLARINAGGLVGLMLSASLPTRSDAEAWLAIHAENLSASDEAKAIEAALGTMSLAFDDRITHADAIAERLSDRLCDGRTMGHAAAWALGWMNARSGWKPTSNQEILLIRQIAGPDADPDVVRWIAGILGRQASREALEPLIPWLKHRSSRVRRAVVEALTMIGGERALAAVRPRLVDSNQGIRRAALSGLAMGMSLANRQLLTADVDGFDPFLDPSEPIDEVRIGKVAARLKLSAETVRARYRALAERFGLHLGFKNANPKAKKPATAK